MKNKSGKLLPFIFSIVLVAGIYIGSIIPKQKVHERLLIYPRTDKLNNILNYIEKEYVDTFSKTTVIEKIIPEVIENLDPHSVYIPASQLQKYNETLAGNFSGIGVKFRMRNDTVVILQCVDGGPSQAVGVLAGDRIVKVDGEVVAGRKMQVDSIVQRLRGPKGSFVLLSVLRKGKRDTLQFNITRNDIPLLSVDAFYMITKEIGYIKISKFSESTAREFKQAAEKLEKRGMKKMILDLRGNGGGYLNLAITIADQFLEENKLIVYTEGRSKARNNFYSTSEGNCTNIELAILLDEWTASASEILAGAIQDNDRGIIVGRRSFGKGLVQEQTEFSDGSALRLTIARYYTPTGRCIQKPYTKGNEDYYNDINHRYEHGEFYQQDSIMFSDSLKYTTPKGRIVYGGGGIMPDIFVPADTSEITPYFVSVRNQGLINNFTFDYTDNNRAKLSKFKDVGSLAKFLEKQNIVEKFIVYAQKNGIYRVNKDIKTSYQLLKTNITAEIVQNFFDDEGYFIIVNNSDKVVESALKELSEKK